MNSIKTKEFFDSFYLQFSTLMSGTFHISAAKEHYSFRQFRIKFNNIFYTVCVPCTSYADKLLLEQTGLKFRETIYTEPKILPDEEVNTPMLIQKIVNLIFQLNESQKELLQNKKDCKKRYDNINAYANNVNGVKVNVRKNQIVFRLDSMDDEVFKEIMEIYKRNK